MIGFYAAACALGVLAGLAFAWIWLRIVPRGTHRRYWQSMHALTREMLQVDDGAAFLRLYGRLFRLLGPYLARNLGGVVLATLPMIAIALTVAPMLFRAWDARAEHATLVYPDEVEPVPLPPAPQAGQRIGYCSTPAWCLTFAGLGFEVVELKEERLPYAVMRADHGDANPLWPFLSDLEAAFFAAFVLSMLVALLWPRRSLKPATTPSFN